MSNSLQKFNSNDNGELSKFEFKSSYTPNQSENDLTPRKLIAILMRYKWLVLFFLIAGGVGAWYYADTIEPVYESKGLLLISSDGDRNSEELSNIISQATGFGTGSTLENELQILQSRTFSEQIVQKLFNDNSVAATELPIMWGTKENGERYRLDEHAVASRIKNKLDFMLPKEEKSDVVEVYFRSTSPRESSLIVNLAMEIYVENSTEQNREAATKTAEFLEKEMKEIKQKLDSSEQRLEAYMDETGIVKVNEQTDGMVQQQADVETELQRARLDLQSVEQTIANYERQLEQIKPGLAEQFADAIGPKIRNSQEDLAEYERERTLIITKNPGVLDRDPLPQRLQYLDKQIERLRTEIDELSSQLFTEDDEYMGMDSEDRAKMVSDLQTQLVQLRTDRNQLVSKIDALEELLNEMNEDINSLPEGITKLAKLQRDVRINEELYVNIRRQFADMSVWKQSQFGYGRVIDSGETPDVPVSPNKKILLLLGVMIGGLLSAGVIFIKEFRDNSVNNVEELRNMYLPSVTVVPPFNKLSRRKRKSFNIGEGKAPSELVMFHDRSSITSEAIRRLKNNVIYQFGDLPPKTIAVTSPEKGDGKSTVVANLGIAFAEEGFKTLIIGTDFRRPKLGHYLGFNGKKGLSDYLEGRLSFEELIRETDQKNLNIITAGQQTDTPEILGSSMLFKQLVKKLEGTYDVIIMDTPPFGIISDSMAILKMVEASLVVAKYRKTHKGMLVRTLEELSRINPNIIGLVLNDFDYRKETSHFYGSGYYQSLYTSYESYVK